MRLYHATDDAHVEGIRDRGFACSHVRDSEGRSLFADSASGTTTAGTIPTWLVIVEVPDAVAEKYRYRFPNGTPYLGNYLIPFDTVNRHRPFDFWRLTEHADPCDER